MLKVFIFCLVMRQIHIRDSSKKIKSPLTPHNMRKKSISEFIFHSKRVVTIHNIKKKINK